MPSNQAEIKHLKNLIQDSLNEAKKQGASAVETSIAIDTGLSVTARLREMETVEYPSSQSLEVTVYMDNKKGVASSNDLKPESIKKTVQAACNIASFTGCDEMAGLPDKEMLATDFPDFANYHPWTIDVASMLDLALECEDAALSYHGEISNSEGSTISSQNSIRVLGNSLNFLHGSSFTAHSISCSVLGKRDSHMQRDYWYSVATNAIQLQSPKAIGIKAATRTIQRLGARSLTTRHCPVLYSSEVASSLIGLFINAVSGSSLYRKSSFLLNTLGSQIFPEFIHIYEQPHLKMALASTAYDAEGVSTKTQDLVADGVLQSYVLNSYSARKLSMQSTGNAGGVHNLTVAYENYDFEAMLKQLNTGLLVTELMGQGVNLTSGNYSRGATGFWVENGQIQYPVEAITIAGNLKHMFKNIVAVGNDVDYRKNIRTGSILIEQMSIAGE